MTNTNSIIKQLITQLTLAITNKRTLTRAGEMHAQWIACSDINVADYDEAVHIVSQVVGTVPREALDGLTPRQWMSEMIFAAACETPGQLGRDICTAQLVHLGEHRS